MAGTETLTAVQLQPLMQEHPNMVNQTVEEVFQSAGHIGDIDTFRMVAQSMPGTAVAGLIVGRLVDKKLMSRFIAALRSRGLEPLPLADDPADQVEHVPINGASLAPADADDLDIDRIGEFASGAKAFRCRVLKHDQVLGSGALISPRLILTSAHVVGAFVPDAASEFDLDTISDVSVLLSDGSEHKARPVWVAPCLDSEKNGVLPGDGDATTMCDAVLLRIRSPLGRTLGHMSLPNALPNWVGTESFVLIHFPEGAEKGIAVGKLRRDRLDEPRHLHSIKTHGGSSGGAGFDRQFNFVGLHQGRWNNVRRLVPFQHFAANDDFCAQIKLDCPPRRLWSLSDDLDGHFVIGRNNFFDALTAILDRQDKNLRGVWIKRTKIAERQGLNFSHTLLDRFLEIHGARHRIVRMQPGYEQGDLTASLNRRALGGSAPIEAQPGVAADETTGTAHEDDRIRTVVSELSRIATERNETVWLYFDNPDSGLIDRTRYQLEHLIEEVLDTPNLRLILAGFETYDLRARTITNLDNVEVDPRPKLFVDYIRPFLRKDVKDCVGLMVRALALKWTPDVCGHIVDLALQGIPAEMNRFAIANLPLVAERLRTEARKDIGVHDAG